MASHNRIKFGMNKPRGTVSLAQQLDDALLENTAIPPNLLHEDRNKIWELAASELLNDWVGFNATTKDAGTLNNYVAQYQPKTDELLRDRITAVCNSATLPRPYQADAVLSALYDTMAGIARDYVRRAKNEPDDQALAPVYIQPNIAAFQNRLNWVELPEKLLDCRSRLQPNGWQTAAETIASDWINKEFPSIAQSRQLPKAQAVAHFARYAHKDEVNIIADRIAKLYPANKRAQQETMTKIMEAMVQTVETAMTVKSPEDEIDLRQRLNAR